MLSLASCRPLKPLSLQEGLLAPGAALPTGLLTFSSHPSSPAVSLPPGAALFFPSPPRSSPSFSPLPSFCLPFFYFPFLPSSLLCRPPFHLPSVFLGSVPHCSPILTCFGPPWLLSSPPAQILSGGSGSPRPFLGRGVLVPEPLGPAFQTYLLPTSVLPLAHLVPPLLSPPPVFFLDSEPARPPPMSLRTLPSPQGRTPGLARGPTMPTFVTPGSPSSLPASSGAWHLPQRLLPPGLSS